jgi:hypothetical protein
MVGTSAVIWKIEHSTVREYEIGGKNSKGVVPWGQRNHIDRIASDSAARRATFSIGIGYNPSNEWTIASNSIATDSLQTVTWAYGMSGGFGYHSQRGIAKLDLRPIKEDPNSGSSASASSGGEVEASSSDDGEALIIALGVTGGVVAVAILLAIVVLAIALVVGTVMRQRRNSSNSKLLQRGSINSSNSEVQLGSVVGEAGQVDVQQFQQKPVRPPAPRPPAPRPPAPAPPLSGAQWGPTAGEEEELPSYTNANAHFQSDVMEI